MTHKLGGFPIKRMNVNARDHGEVIREDILLEIPNSGVSNNGEKDLLRIGFKTHEDVVMIEKQVFAHGLENDPNVLEAIELYAKLKAEGCDMVRFGWGFEVNSKNKRPLINTATVLWQKRGQIMRGKVWIQDFVIEFEFDERPSERAKETKMIACANPIVEQKTTAPIRPAFSNFFSKG